MHLQTWEAIEAAAVSSENHKMLLLVKLGFGAVVVVLEGVGVLFGVVLLVVVLMKESERASRKKAFRVILRCFLRENWSCRIASAVPMSRHTLNLWYNQGRHGHSNDRLRIVGRAKALRWSICGERQEGFVDAAGTYARGGRGNASSGEHQRDKRKETHYSQRFDV